MYVCDLITHAGTLQPRSGIAKGREEYAGLLFVIPLVGVIDIIIGAIEGACGKKVAGELILKRSYGSFNRRGNYRRVISYF